ncbi:MAG: hypothetical protein WCG21_10310 [Eubacteriales bacterium]
MSIPAQDVSTWPEYIIKVHAEMVRKIREQAMNLLHLVLRDKPEDVQALLGISRISIRTGDIRAAIDGYQELVRRYDYVEGPVTDKEIDLMIRWLEAGPVERIDVIKEWQAVLESVWDDLSDRLPEEKMDLNSESVINEDADLANNLLDLADETWELAEDGYGFAADTGEAVQDAIVDDAGVWHAVW